MKEIISQIENEGDKMTYKNKTISKRNDGRWCARYVDNGKQKSVYGKTQKECLEKLKKALKTTEKKEKENIIEKYTFFSWLDFWNETYKKPYNKTDNISRNIRLHIKSKIKDKPLTQIKAVDIQLILNQIEGSKTKQEVFNIINGSLRTAYINDYIKKNPCQNVDKIKHQRNVGSALTISEQAKFLQDINGSIYENYFKICLYTGMRRSEALNVTEQDVNFEDKRIHIRGTKTTNSDRYIPLFNIVENILKNITPINGKYFDLQESAVTHNFHRYCPNHKLHDLRHTFATRCLEQGIDMKVIQHWLGHSNYNTTANIYAEVQYQLNSQETIKINQYFDTNFDTKIDTKK